MIFSLYGFSFFLSLLLNIYIKLFKYMYEVIREHNVFKYCAHMFWVAQYLFFYTPRERSSGGYIEITLSVRLSVRPSICLSVRLSVQIGVRPITFLWFDIGLPYLAHGCITMRRYVTYIHDPDTTLTFDLKSCLHVRLHVRLLLALTLAYQIWQIG